MNFIALALAAALVSAPALAQTPLDPKIEKRVEDLLGRMTLEEKLGQLQQLGDDGTGLVQKTAARGLLGSTLGISGAAKVNALQRENMEKSRLKIPILFAHDVIHGFRTIFSNPLGEAAMWDPDAAEAAAAVAAAEAAAAGLKWTFAPMVDVARDPRWGRISEGAGEDPFLGARMAVARVIGFQGGDPSAPDKVLACAKHYVAYGAAEGGRDYNTTDVPERTLREIYFPPFHAAVQVGVSTLMAAFNSLNGMPAHANRFTLTDVLRGEWGFRGFVVSDFTGVQELVNHGIAKDGAEAGRKALLAGVDMEMVSRNYNQGLLAQIKSGAVPMAVVDEAARRVLREKFRAGLFERPYADEAAEKTAFLKPEYLALAKRNAEKSFVLLKNEGGILPLAPSVKKVALVGPLAEDASAMLGSWAGEGKKEDAVTILKGLRAAAPGLTVLHAAGCDAACKSSAGFEGVVAVAKEADVVVAVVGEDGTMNGEAASRSNIDLPGMQLDLLKAVAATGKPLVVVLVNGRPLTIGWVAQNAKAILEVWHPGVQAGPAVADTLLGKVSPGGKLPVTFPRVVGQVPMYYNRLNTGRPPTKDDYEKEAWVSRYADLPLDPQYPFGWGLSYTTFKLSNFYVTKPWTTGIGRASVYVTVENTGAREGDEVVQLYTHRPAASVSRPIRELKGFERVTLKPGEKRELHFMLTDEILGFLDADMKFAVEPGVYELFAGTSSVGGLKATYEVEGPARK